MSVMDARPRARRHAASLWPQLSIDIAGHLPFCGAGRSGIRWRETKGTDQ